MSVHTSANRFPIDALLVLRTAGEAAMTATGASDSSLALDVATGYWQAGDSAAVATDLDFAVEVIVESFSAQATASFAVEVATDSAFTSPSAVATIAATGTGRLTLVVDREEVRNVLGTSATGFLRVKATLGGTSPSVGWNAYVAPLTGL